MHVFASIAHRGSTAFLAALYENAKNALHPRWSCVFAEKVLGLPRTTTFVETDSAERHGTIAVLARYMRCFAYLCSTGLNRSEHDVLVFVAANQRFFKPCRLDPFAFSFTPLKVTLLKNIQNPFGWPVGFPSTHWTTMMGRYASRLASRRYDARAEFGMHLRRLNLTGLSPLPNAVTHAEVRALLPRAPTSDRARARAHGERRAPSTRCVTSTRRARPTKRSATPPPSTPASRAPSQKTGHWRRS